MEVPRKKLVDFREKHQKWMIYDDLGYREVALLKRKPPFLRIRDDHGHRDPRKTHVVFGCSWAESLEFWDDIII